MTSNLKTLLTRSRELEEKRNLFTLYGSEKKMVDALVRSNAIKDKIIEVQAAALKKADELYADDKMRTTVIRQAIEQVEGLASGI